MISVWVYLLTELFQYVSISYSIVTVIETVDHFTNFLFRAFVALMSCLEGSIRRMIIVDVTVFYFLPLVTFFVCSTKFAIKSISVNVRLSTLLFCFLDEGRKVLQPILTTKLRCEVEKKGTNFNKLAQFWR